MLTVLAVGAIATLLFLILFRVTSVLVALILVPVAAALLGGFGISLGGYALDGIRAVAPVAALLGFAVIYFGIMNDAGLFEPILRSLIRVVGTNPVRIALGTAAVASVAHLDGAGASTFMVTVPSMLPLYQRAGMSPLTLTCITALAAGTMNMLPWGGPTTRAATVLQISATQLFVPVIPAMLIGMAGVFAFAAQLGRQERDRLRGSAPAFVAAEEGFAPVDPEAPVAAGPPVRRGLWTFNAALTTVTIAALFAEVVPLPLVFMVAAAIALIVNYPDAHEQRERLTSHGAAAMMMVTTIFAAGVFTGVLTGSGMLTSLATDLVAVLPGLALRHLPTIMAIAAMPLSLVFDPDSFYFGLLPVLASASDAAGGSGTEVARAAVLGQMTTGFPVSPLTPATFLLVGLANVDLADHQRRTIPYAFAVTLLMTLAAFATGALSL